MRLLQPRHMAERWQSRAGGSEPFPSPFRTLTLGGRSHIFGALSAASALWAGGQRGKRLQNPTRISSKNCLYSPCASYVVFLFCFVSPVDESIA